jgi:hypothetical protein
MARSREITGLIASIVTLASGVAVAQGPPSSAAPSQEAPPLSTATTSAPNGRTTQSGEPQKSQRAEEDLKLDRRPTERERERYRQRRHIPERQRVEQAKEIPQHAAEARQRELPDRHSDPLWRAYFYWSFIQLCNLGRQNSFTTDTNDVELERARRASSTIEKDAIAKDPKTNLDETFAQADETARANFGTGLLQRKKCRHALKALLSMSPVSPYQAQRRQSPPGTSNELLPGRGG